MHEDRWMTKPSSGEITLQIELWFSNGKGFIQDIIGRDLRVVFLQKDPLEHAYYARQTAPVRKWFRVFVSDAVKDWFLESFHPEKVDRVKQRKSSSKGSQLLKQGDRGTTRRPE